MRLAGNGDTDSERDSNSYNDNDIAYRAFSHNVTAATLVYQNNETAVMLVYQTNSAGVMSW